jgi:hypothetical protein
MAYLGDDNTACGMVRLVAGMVNWWAGIVGITKINVSLWCTDFTRMKYGTIYTIHI